MKGIIEKITIYPKKAEIGIEVTQGHLIENLGLEGDFHAKGGERQISLLFAENHNELMGQKEKGLCFSRYKENLFIKKLDGVKSGAELKPGGQLKHGTQLITGDIILEITAETKRCHEECPLYEQGKQCALTGLNLFAKVVKGGVIRTGDIITVQ
jgi:MOSC domain-containing protein YiiM